MLMINELYMRKIKNLFGKTLFFNLKQKSNTLLGHKNPQGLIKFKDKLL